MYKRIHFVISTIKIRWNDRTLTLFFSLFPFFVYNKYTKRKFYRIENSNFEIVIEFHSSNITQKIYLLLICLKSLQALLVLFLLLRKNINVLSHIYSHTVCHCWLWYFSFTFSRQWILYVLPVHPFIHYKVNRLVKDFRKVYDIAFDSFDDNLNVLMVRSFSNELQKI